MDTRKNAECSARAPARTRQARKLQNPLFDSFNVIEELGRLCLNRSEVIAVYYESFLSGFAFNFEYGAGSVFEY